MANRRNFLQGLAALVGVGAAVAVAPKVVRKFDESTATDEDRALLTAWMRHDLVYDFDTQTYRAYLGQGQWKTFSRDHVVERMPWLQLHVQSTYAEEAKLTYTPFDRDVFRG